MEQAEIKTERATDCLMRCDMTIDECVKRQCNNLRYYAKSLKSSAPKLRPMFVTCARGGEAGSPCPHYVTDSVYCDNLDGPAVRDYRKFLQAKGDVKELVRKLLIGGGNA